MRFGMLSLGQGVDCPCLPNRGVGVLFWPLDFPHSHTKSSYFFGLFTALPVDVHFGWLDSVVAASWEAGCGGVTCVAVGWAGIAAAVVVVWSDIRLWRLRRSSRPSWAMLYERGGSPGGIPITTAGSHVRPRRTCTRSPVESFGITLAPLSW